MVDKKWDSHCMCYGPYTISTTTEGDRGHPWWCPVCVGAPDEDACRVYYSVTYDVNVGWSEVGWQESSDDVAAALRLQLQNLLTAHLHPRQPRPPPACPPSERLVLQEPGLL